MPLLGLWASSPQHVDQPSINQVVKIAGDGNLKDKSICSQELREYLTKVPSSKIAWCIEQCLSAGFESSGMILQDLVNELGRRLDYDVVNGRYKGTPNQIGFDGRWRSPEGHNIIVEVKTTDAYRVSLATIAGYRDKLIENSDIAGLSSILIVVGREDTGELEAQVRGSRFAWDIRMISADALGKLVQLKENAEGSETGRKIRSLLIPMEYTRLDNMIDILFTTAKDTAEAADEVLVTDSADSPPDVPDTNSTELATKLWQFTDNEVLREIREKIIKVLGQRDGTTYVKKGGALYWNPLHDMRIACTLSKKYERAGFSGFWYGYHEHWDKFLQEGQTSLLVLGCVGAPFAFAIPWAVLHPVLPSLGTTVRASGTYWHIRVSETSLGHYALMLGEKLDSLSLDTYRLDLV